MDTPMHGKRAAIKINRQRYKCLDCGRTFQQQLPDMDVKRHMTRRLLDYIQRRSLERTFTEVAQDVGLDEKTVRNIFTDFIRELNARYQPVTPSWLGIDELFLVRKPRCILTNIREKTVVDILADRNKPTISRWLAQRDNRDKVEIVTMDMWKAYRDVTRALLPNTRVVVDKFHVTRMANQCLDAVRKQLRENMDAKTRRKLMHDRHILLRRRAKLEPMDFMLMQAWTDALPPLLAAYNAKGLSKNKVYFWLKNI